MYACRTRQQTSSLVQSPHPDPGHCWLTLVTLPGRVLGETATQVLLDCWSDVGHNRIATQRRHWW